jgi:hypothetical protein
LRIDVNKDTNFVTTIFSLIKSHGKFSSKVVNKTTDLQVQLVVKQWGTQQLGKGEEFQTEGKITNSWLLKLDHFRQGHCIS